MYTYTYNYICIHVYVHTYIYTWSTSAACSAECICIFQRVVGNAAAKAGFTDTWGRSAAQYKSERSWSLVGQPGSPRRREPNLSSLSPLSAPGRPRDSDYCKPPVLSQTTAKPEEFSGRRLAIHRRLELTMSALCERPVLELVIVTMPLPC